MILATLLCLVFHRSLTHGAEPQKPLAEISRVPVPEKPLPIQLDFTSEVVEVAVTGTLLGGIALLNTLKPDFSTPQSFEGDRTDYPIMDETFPNWTLGVGIGVIITGITFLPNQSGWLNDVTYVNTKGLIQSLAVTGLSTILAKQLVARKRPDHDAQVATGSYTDDVHYSFWSGHASTSFSLSTYASLYIMDHVGDWDNGWHVFGKIGSSAVLMGLATWVAYSRVDNNRHFPSEVVVGSLVGATVSTLIYGWQNEWFNKRYRRVGEEKAVNVTVNLMPGAISLSYQY